MPACGIASMAGQTRPCTYVSVPTIPCPPSKPRTATHTPMHVRPVRDSPVSAQLDAPQRHAPNASAPSTVAAAATPTGNEEAGFPQSRTHSGSTRPSLLGNPAARTSSGKRSSCALGSPVTGRRATAGARSLAPFSGAEHAAPAKRPDSAAAARAPLPALSPTKVAKAEECRVAAASLAELSPTSTGSSSRVSARLSEALRCSRSVDSESEVWAPMSLTPAVLYATEEEPAVEADPDGVRCCPLLDQRDAAAGTAPATTKAASVVTNEQVNLSPFLNWRFVPYLPAQTAGRQRPTIVLDIDETLLHTSVEPMIDADAIIEVVYPTDESRGAAVATGSDSTSRYKLYIRYRPYLERFLLFCLSHFEVVIFTAGKAYYAHAVLGQLQIDFPTIAICLDGSGADAATSAALLQRAGDESRVIHMLHRDHCTPTNVGYTKDLHLLGRDLRRTVLVDNNKVCGVFQPYNSVHVKDFARRRCSEPVSEQQWVRTSQLRQLKGTIPGSTADPVNAFSSVAAMTCSTSTHDWEDNEDAVLLHLCATGGLLHRISKSLDVPSYLQHTVHWNRAQQ